MSDERLRELYAAAAATGRAGADARHPAPEALAALARREGPEETRLATLDHVMGCAECRREFDLLRSVERAGSDSGAASRAGSPRKWFMPVALAASLLLAVGIGRQVLRPSAEDTTRGDGEASPVVLLHPGAEMAAGEPITFTWRPVPGASRYELELLDAGGGVAAAAATSDTSASPQAARVLPPGEYRWWVRATTADARALRSALRPLRLTAK